MRPNPRICRLSLDGAGRDNLTVFIVGGCRYWNQDSCGERVGQLRFISLGNFSAVGLQGTQHSKIGPWTRRAESCNSKLSPVPCVKLQVPRSRGPWPSDSLSMYSWLLTKKIQHGEKRAYMHSLPARVNWLRELQLLQWQTVKKCMAWNNAEKRALQWACATRPATVLQTVNIKTKNTASGLPKT